MQETAGETAPASPGPDSPQVQEPSQLEELADFMEQVGVFSCLFSTVFSSPVCVLNTCS